MKKARPRMNSKSDKRLWDIAFLFRDHRAAVYPPEDIAQALLTGFITGARWQYQRKFYWGQEKDRARLKQQKWVPDEKS